MAGIRDERLREGPVIEYEVLTVFTHDRDIKSPVWRIEIREEKLGHESLKVRSRSQQDIKSR
jgi:hypothetical protein